MEAKDRQQQVPERAEEDVVEKGRRELLERFGTYAKYAAPFTVFALTEKAHAATGRGPGKH